MVPKKIQNKLTLKTIPIALSASLRWTNKTKH
jgi:hypothetical protein